VVGWVSAVLKYMTLADAKILGSFSSQSSSSIKVLDTIITGVLHWGKLGLSRGH
jgi:hypothetical protein